MSTLVERLNEYSKDWRDRARSNDVVVEAAERIEELERQNAALRNSLREMFCPRPCNHRPSEFDVGDCVDADECGCGANHALSDSTPTDSWNKS